MSVAGYLLNDDNHYSLTDSGRALIQELGGFYSEEGIDGFFRQIVLTLNDIPLDKLLTQVYAQYNIEQEYDKGDTIEPIIGDEE